MTFLRMAACTSAFCHDWLLYSFCRPSAAMSAGNLNSWPVLTVSPAHREEQLSPERSRTGPFLSEACFAIGGLFSPSALIPLALHPHPRLLPNVVVKPLSVFCVFSGWSVERNNSDVNPPGANKKVVLPKHSAVIWTMT